jgi:hypothetical protein
VVPFSDASFTDLSEHLHATFTTNSPPKSLATTKQHNKQCQCPVLVLLSAFSFQRFSVFSFQYRTRKKQQTNGAKEFVAGASPSRAAFSAPKALKRGLLYGHVTGGDTIKIRTTTYTHPKKPSQEQTPYRRVITFYHHTMVVSEDDYPLNCIDSTGDGFSGWFAITNPRKCNDFCYWRKETTKNSTNDDANEENNGGDRYTSRNTANPHQTTVIYDDANNNNSSSHQPTTAYYWVCIYDSADDKTLVSQVNGEKWIDTWHDHLDKKTTINNINYMQDNGNKNVPFPYLRCQKGAGEEIRTYSGDAVQSSIFWESWIILCSLIIVTQIATLYMRYKKRKSRYDRLNASNTESVVMNGIDDLQLDDETCTETDRYDRLMSSNGTTLLTEQESMEIEDSRTDNPTGIDNPITERVLPSADDNRRCKYCAPYLSHRALGLLRVLSIVALNILLVITIAFSSLSLMETKFHVQLSESMEKLTPECTNPYFACEKGNQEIDKPSTYKSPIEKSFVRSESTSSMKPFSYIIASDAQLHWFNGEFAEMGEKNIPSSCTEKDSCGKCTAKHGYNTNLRMKRAWEMLMTGKTDGMVIQEDNNSSIMPIPNTLVMNGDLTAYFHPYQKDAYDSIYSDIDGLKQYFPGLGNHDIEHAGGAKYGGDEWIGPPNCNVEHAIGYLKSGFCGKIPHFLPERIVRYDPSSLAYSWEEGRYHFVMLHYYPTYELASMSFRSSMVWLERDLQLAHDSGLSTILYVHAAEGLNPAMEDAILGKGVKAIFAGHTHRCLHRRCDGIYPLNEDQVNNLDSLNMTVDSCMPAAYDVCEALE